MDILSKRRKYLSYVILLFCAGWFILPGCKLLEKRKLERQTPVEIIQPEKEEKVTTIEPEKIDTASVINLPDDKNRVKYDKKDIYNVAVLLPLLLDFIDTGYQNLTSKPIPVESMLGIEFYEGMLLALDSLEQMGLSLNLHIYDTENNPIETRFILQQLAQQDLDLIIGPVYNSNLKLAADFARKKQIPLISPLSPSDKVTRKNPFYFMVNPTIEVHLNRMAQFICRMPENWNILLIHPVNYVEIQYASRFKELLLNHCPQDILQLKEIVFSEEDKGKLTGNEEIRPALEDTTVNVVIVPTLDARFAMNVYRELNRYSGEVDSIIVFGMPTWLHNEALRLDYLLKLNTHLTTNFYVDDSSFQYQKFRLRYLHTFATEPSVYAIAGYDIMMFFGLMLNKYGNSFPEQLPAENVKRLHTRFRFNPVLIPDLDAETGATINYWENKYVHLLKYDPEHLTVHPINAR